MKRVWCKTFAEGTRPDQGSKRKKENDLVNGYLAKRLRLQVATLWFAVCLPLAAQVTPPPPNGLPASQSPLGDLTSLTGDARIWLQDLIKINTTSPPGNEQ